MSIKVSHLVKQYGSQKAVNNLSFEIEKGEIVGFLGPNGAGKSTTMKIVTGYLQADSGLASVCGIDVKQNQIAAKRKIGYLPESNPLYYDMYVKEYLAFVAGIHKIVDPKKRIAEMLDLIGLTSEKGKKLGQLSKGYKQRAGLAAALIHDPEVLILDEPTTGLDPNQIVEIRNVIKNVGKNKTVLFSSHILQEVEAICSRVIIINKGELKKDAPIGSLTKTDSHATIKVHFREALESSWLLRLPAVLTAEKDGRGIWTLQSDNADAAKKQIMTLAINENLNIISLESGSADLENTFRELTK